jgi:integrase
MAIRSFGAMCRYSDISRLKWKNIKFESDSNFFEITFEIRKNAQFRQGNKLIVSATNDVVCLLHVLRALQSVSNSEGDGFIFRYFNGRLVATNPGKTTPMVMTIKYAQYMRYLSLWFGGILGLTPRELKGPYGS